MKNLTPNVGPHSHGISYRGQSTCRMDARPIGRPIGDFDYLRGWLEHRIALPDLVDHLAELCATLMETITVGGRRRIARPAEASAEPLPINRSSRR